MNDNPLHTTHGTSVTERFRPLPDDHGFGFQCVPDRCDMRCCTTGHPLVLNPGEIGLIRQATGIPFDTLEDDFFAESYDPATGFPLVTIPRAEGCRFLDGNACSIYAARPLVCRMFPLGKFYDPGEGAFRTVMLGDNPCAGFSENVRQTVAAYKGLQVTERLDRMWEEWTDFVNAVETGGALPDSSLFRAVFGMMIYNADLPPGPEITPEDYEGMGAEEAMTVRLRTALDALPKLNSIFARSSGSFR